jgi:hypothetical protein
MAQLTKQALLVENNTSFPNNNTGAITPTILRNFNTDMIDSTVNQEAYTTASALVDGRLDSLENFTGSALITASAAGGTITFEKGDGSTFDVAVTASVGSVDWDNITDKPSGLVSGSSQVVSILTSVNAYTASNDVKWNNIASQSGSWENVPLTSLNAFTASQETKNSTLASYTGSVDTKFTTIGTQSGSWDNTLLNAFTQSQETKNTTLGGVTASLQQQLTNIGSQSGSWVTESETGSFARTNVSNTFTATQNITGDLNVTGTITANEIHTIIESSSVIFSSGSNILGDAASDTQTLNGSVNVVNQLTASGLHYPTTDGTFSGQVLQTNAAGQLSFGNVNAVFETIRNGESTTITTGTPLFVSGALGANPIVYRANTSDPTKMPVTFLAMEDILANQNGRGITLGLITGIDMTGYPVGTILWTDGLGQLTSTRPTGSNDIVQPIGVVTKTGAGGQLNVLNPGPVLMPNIQTGYTWVGNGSNQPVAVATSSFASLTDLTLLNAFTASQETKNSTLASYTGSVDTQLTNLSTSQSIDNTKWDTIGTQSGSWSGGGTDLTSLNAFTASQQVLNATFATTGSNSFIGNQTILGNITASGNISGQAASVSTNASYPVLFISGGGTISKDSVDTLLYNPSTNQLLVSGTTGNSNISPNAITFQSGSGAYGTYASTISKNGFISSVEGSGYISIQGNPSKTGAPSLTTSTKPGVLAMSSSGQPYVAIELQPSGSGFSDGRVTFPRNVAMLQNLEITGSLTSSLQQGYVWVGDVNGRTTTVPTSSFGGGGGSTFPYSGTASISGSLQVTGSMSGLVNELVVTSNTASIDFTKGNFFSITLAGGATTRFEVANTILGQTINIQINQPAGASTGSVVFSPTILFAGGNDYQATATGSAIDLLTLAAITGSTVLATSIKNFL